jgi:hypothetical protein
MQITNHNRISELVEMSVFFSSGQPPAFQSTEDLFPWLGQLTINHPVQHM